MIEPLDVVQTSLLSLMGQPDQAPTSTALIGKKLRNSSMRVLLTSALISHSQWTRKKTKTPIKEKVQTSIDRNLRHLGLRPRMPSTTIINYEYSNN